MDINDSAVIIPTKCVSVDCLLPCLPLPCFFLVALELIKEEEKTDSEVYDKSYEGQTQQGKKGST